MFTHHRNEMKGGLLRALAWIAVGAAFLVLSNFVAAATPVDRNSMLFPYYEVEEVLASTSTHHYARNTSALLNHLQRLQDSTAAYCEGKVSREVVARDYGKTYLSWLELSAVAMGPMLEKNTIRQVDFRPLRVNLLDRAIQRQPVGEQAMAMVGSPAKGFPAVEYLLQQHAFKPDSPQCSYAIEVVRDIGRAIASLNWQEGPADADTLKSNMQLYFNQLLGATHNLAWERMEKPLLKNQNVAALGGITGAAPQWPFAELDLTEQAWLAHWQGVEELLVLHGQVVPQADKQVIPLEAYLRGLGQIDLADALVSHSELVSKALNTTRISNTQSIAESVQAVKTLKGFLEQEVAKGLKVSIQFSSSDGD